MGFEVLDYCHLGIGRLIGLCLAPDLGQQVIPQLHEGMGLLLQHEPQLVGHHSTIAHKHTGHVLEGVSHIARCIDHPRLLGLAQKVLQTLADNAPTGVHHQVGNIALIVHHQICRLVQMGIHRLSSYQHGTPGLHEHATKVTQHMRRHIGRRQLNATLRGKDCRREVEQRLRNRHIDMHRSATLHESLIDQSVAVPTALTVVRFRQSDGLIDKTTKGVGLGHRLTVQLVYPLGRTVGTDSHQGYMLIISLSDSRRQIQQRRPTGDTDGNRLMKTLAHA